MKNLNSYLMHFFFLLLLSSAFYVILYFLPFPGIALSQQHHNIEDYEEIMADKYPAYATDLKRMLHKYPYWIITLEEKYGLPPLLAMLNSSEFEFALLFRDPAMFMDIYQHLPSQVGTKEQRARYAILLAQALSLAEPDTSYQHAFQRALEQDLQKDRSMRRFTPDRGGETTRRFLEQNSHPQNYFHVLQADPERLAVFLELIQQMDYRVIKIFIDYPNAGTFLMQTGLDGYDLLMEHGDEVLFLSLFLESEDQKKLPMIFRRYPEIGMVIEELSLEGFQVFLAMPEFYSSFMRNFHEDCRFGCLLAYSYIKAAQEHLGLEEFVQLATGKDMVYLTGALTDISKRDNIDGSSAILSLINDPFVTEFLLKYRNRAVNLLADYGNLQIAELIMHHWDFSRTAQQVGIEAIEQFGFMGIQALYHFSYNEEIKRFVAHYGLKSLMVLHYEDQSKYNRIFTDKNDALDNYTLEPRTGFPIPVETGVIEFVPGHDLVKNAYLALKHQRLPTLGETTFSMLDGLSFVPILKPVSVFAKTTKTTRKGITVGKRICSKIGKHTIKSRRGMINKNLKKIYRKQPIDINTVKKNIQNRPLGKSIKKTFRNIRSATSGADRHLSDNYWFLKTRTYRPDIKVSDIVDRSRIWTVVSKITIKNLPDITNFNLNYLKPALSPSVDWLKNELLLSFLCYAGVIKLENYIKDQLMQQLEELEG